MNILKTSFKGLYIIQLEKIGDERGWFMRTFDINIMKQLIQDCSGEWVQMNHSYSAHKHTWRGFHYQREPFQETKIVRCISGSALDCVLDLRSNSETYLKVFTIELTKENNKMLYIPKGFAHGFLTLTDHVELTYIHDEFYNPEYETGVRFDDKVINLDLPYKPLIISERDKNHKLLEL